MTTPEQHLSYQAEKHAVPERESERMEKFLAYRKESSKKVNDEIILPYYEGRLTTLQMKEYLGLSEEQTQTVCFMLDSFSKPKSLEKLFRKDGSYIGVHSLQLFLTARDFFHLQNDDVLVTLLVHDIAEDTQVSLENIAAELGHHTAALAAVMTEERDESRPHDPVARKKDAVYFAERIRRSGVVAAAAEVIDRMDDIADLSYLLDPLSKTTNEAAREGIREKLLIKFGKCQYTIRKIQEVADDDGKRLVEHFHALLGHQRSSIGTVHGMRIGDEDVEKEAASYQVLEKELGV